MTSDREKELREIAEAYGEQFALMVAEAQTIPDPSIPCVAPWSFADRIFQALLRVDEEARKDEQERYMRGISSITLSAHRILMEDTQAEGERIGEEREREANCLAIRAACGPCGGTGSVAEPGHDCGGDPDLCARRCPIETESECEYCGRPIAAIRARGQGGEEPKR